MIFIYLLAIGCALAALRHFEASKLHNIRVKAGHKATQTRKRNQSYIPVNLSGHKYKIKRGK